MNDKLTIPLTEEELCTCIALKEYLIELELLTPDSNGICYENEWNTQISHVLEQMNIELNGIVISQNDNIIKYDFFIFKCNCTFFLFISKSY